MMEAVGSYGCEIVAVRRGSAGQAVLDVRGRHRWEIPAYPARPADPTGAGDAYGGGFLAGYKRTYDPLQAALHANISASLKIEGTGAFYPSTVLEGLAQSASGWTGRPGQGDLGENPWLRRCRPTHVTERVLDLAAQNTASPRANLQGTQTRPDWCGHISLAEGLQDISMDALHNVYARLPGRQTIQSPDRHCPPGHGLFDAQAGPEA